MMRALDACAAVLTAEPCCVYPLIVVGPLVSLRAGRTEVSWIVLTPAPGMLKLIVSAPASRLASVIAARRLQVPADVRHTPFAAASAASEFVLTTNVVAAARAGTRGRAARAAASCTSAPATQRGPGPDGPRAATPSRAVTQSSASCCESERSTARSPVTSSDRRAPEREGE